MNDEHEVLTEQPYVIGRHELESHQLVQESGSQITGQVHCVTSLGVN